MGKPMRTINVQEPVKLRFKALIEDEKAERPGIELPEGAFLTQLMDEHEQAKLKGRK